MSDLSIRLAVLDMAGTTVTDDGAVLDAFAAAARAVGLPSTGPEHDRNQQYIIDTMGQSKIVVFRALLDDDDLAEQANTAFEHAYDERIAAGAVKPIEGARAAIDALRAAGIIVALSTGFSSRTQGLLIDALGWGGSVDLIVAPSDTLRGRPYPDMILSALITTRIDDVREVAVLGDTSNDILSGVRAGAGIVAGTLTGAHDETALRAAGATDIITSVADLPDLITR